MHIIGVQLIDDDGYIFKDLKKTGQKEQNGWYPFYYYQGYENPPDIKKPIEFDIKYNFYQLKNNPNIKISINAIVGKNGSGKSTLLDILYRIINNISYIAKQSDTYVGCDELIYSFGFSATLFFSLSEYQENEKIFEKVSYCKISDNEYELYINDDIKSELYRGKIDKKSGAIITLEESFLTPKIFEKLFYTIVTNYSMYSFNPEDYPGNSYYPIGIFHKNDAYITPIVLLPFRDNGAIDILGERDLARQRIISLQIFLKNLHKKNLISNRTPKKISYSFNHDYIVEKEKTVDSVYSEFISRLKNRGCESLDFLTKDNLFSSFKNTWETYLEDELKTENINDKIEDIEIQTAIKFYLALKTIKICGHYGLFIESFDANNLNNSLLEIVKLIATNKSFITLKVRQCIEFIKTPYPLNFSDTKKILEYEIKDINPIDETIDGFFLKLPPTIFHTDLIFEEKGEEGNPIKMSALSSGELQLLNTFSYVLYHLKNLEYDKSNLERSSETSYPNYNNFLLIFDEAELYMHPEFQRLFLNELLELLNNCNFNPDKIKQIQIIVATHSPFIISDIPAQNLLMLENGEIRKNDCNINQTFGANIYDLLKNQFFMSAPIGEIAKNRINKIIEYVNTESFDPEINKEYKNYVKFLGDSYFQNTLSYLLQKKEKANKKS